ncbi:DUF1697 domain-containing protein [Nocardia bovistercoris]|uniref:DUF1697 domain-containing protein n=1 Tax=Nocardia bovistercoris TaxID=2785916 RepID=A0A931N8B8_9NOCA|nr:DUF1697 domain-containing protein [Nocardia bovistercoris]MBH0781613.1 DUF1697 domain-containing protein [Nocardia bovistercoris]
MNSYAALLRGIMPSNPNMRNEKLRGVFEGLGFDRVATLLSSGNVVFRCADSDEAELEDRIQEALNRELGIAGGTIVRGHEDLRALIDRDPFAGRTHERGTYLTVTFFKDRHPEVATPEAADELTEIIGYDAEARAFLTVIDNSTPRTPDFMAWLDKTYGKDITTRTWLTIQKVVKKLEA